MEGLNTLAKFDSHKEDNEVDILAQKVGKNLEKILFHVEC